MRLSPTFSMFQIVLPMVASAGLGVLVWHRPIVAPNDAQINHS
jgi:hypothetical protein